jgi:hypothetical protein
MCWQCDHPGSTTEDYFEELYETIDEQGWAVQHVDSDRTQFAYTIGLSRWRLPELLVTGVSPRRAVRLLNNVGRMVVAGDPLAPGKQITLPAGPLVETVEVDQPDAHLKFAVAIFGHRVTALQLVWPDRRGRWPWSADFDDGRGTQPVLGVRAVRRTA